MSDIDTNTIEQAATAKTIPSTFTPAMFTPLNVAKVVTVAVAPVVAALHYFVHQSFTTDAVEFGIGGAFVAWFFMLLCNPHLVDKIPNLGETSDWNKHLMNGLDIDLANPNNSTPNNNWESSNNAYDYSYFNTLGHDSTDYVSHHFGCDTISHISSE